MTLILWTIQCNYKRKNGSSVLSFFAVNCGIHHYVIFQNMLTNFMWHLYHLKQQSTACFFCERCTLEKMVYILILANYDIFLGSLLQSMCVLINRKLCQQSTEIPLNFTVKLAKNVMHWVENELFEADSIKHANTIIVEPNS